MKINLSLSKAFGRLSVNFIVLFTSLLIISPFASFHGDLAAAEEFAIANSGIELEGLSFPYEKTFTISAYYSPLPCQKKYVTGSYESDIRLNGRGVNGADGTPVYPGMIAAPSSYAFGTKLYIPTIGIVAVHDRGGAIVASNVEGVYDRLDIWMGYGDKGLNRALNWGKRTIEVTVYGLNENVIEDIYLDNYSPDEAIVNDCIYERPEVIVKSTENINSVITDEPIVEAEKKEIILANTLSDNLTLGDEGNDVVLLQEELNKLNYYKAEIHGIYDETTQHAVYKFQQSQYLVGDLNSPGAGIFGPKTRDRLNEIIFARNYTKVLVAQISSEKNLPKEEFIVEVDVDPVMDIFVEKSLLLTSELSYGMVDSDVRILQEFLRDQGFFNGALTTDYFGFVTYESLVNFQFANGIISSPEDLGAGRVGPATLKLINSLS